MDSIVHCTKEPLSKDTMLWIDMYINGWMDGWIWTAALDRQIISGLLYQKFRIINKIMT